MRLTKFYWFLTGRHPRDRNHLLRREGRRERVLREEELVERRTEAVTRQPPDVGRNGHVQEELADEGAREEDLPLVIEQLDECGASASSPFPHRCNGWASATST